MEEGAENSTAPVAVPEAAVDRDQPAEGSTVPTAVVRPEETIDMDQHTERVAVPTVVRPDVAAGVEQHAEGVAVPTVVAPEEAVGADQHAEGSTVPMVVTEEAAGVDQHPEGSTVPMVVTEQAVDAEQHADGLAAPMVGPEQVVDAEQHAEGSTVPMVVTEQAIDTEQHADGMPVPMVVPEEAVDTEQHVEVLAPAPMVTPEVAADGDHHIEDVTTQDKHGDTDGIINVTPEETRGIIEVIADTGKFWHEWSYLKRLLSLQLMQVLGEYSEAQMVIREGGQQQNSSSAETNSELFRQLNDALLRFEEGPPFTLQRLCEILLDPKGTYKKLSKLAWALEKTLLVTSTITKCTDPYPAAHGPVPEGAAEITEKSDPVGRLPEQHPAAVPNGTEHAGGGDDDEEMADAEAEAVLPGSHDDVEMQEEKPDQMVGVSSGTTSGGAAVACETAGTSSEQSPDRQS